MDTGKQINAMVVVLLLTVALLGFYALSDPFRADTAEDDQLHMTAQRAATTFALNCRLCHGDRGQGGAAGGRLPAAPALDRPDLQGIQDGVFNSAVFTETFNWIHDTIMCGRAGTSMPTWGRSQGGTLSDEQIRQLVVLIMGGDSRAEVLHKDAEGTFVGGFWDLAQEHADELDAQATEHSTLQMPEGSLNATATELTVSNASPMAVDQYIRIDGERMQIVDIPSTNRTIVRDIGREPDELYVSSAEGFEVGEIIRLEHELLEVTGVREDGNLHIKLDAPVTASADIISVDQPAFFSGGYVVRAGSEQIEVVGAVETGQLVFSAIGRADTTVSVSGSLGIEQGSQIRIGEELLRVINIEPALVGVERAASDLQGNVAPAAAHSAGAAILRLVEDPAEGMEPEDPDTGQFLLEGLGASGSSVVVSGTSGISIGQTYQIGNEFVTVTDVEPATLRVERGVGGTERGEHARRVPIYQGNLLEVERGALDTSAAAHDAGTDLLFDILDVKREVQGTKVEDHSKNAEIFLGHRIIVDRGALDTQAVAHENGTLVLNFPAPPEDPAITPRTCGNNPPLATPASGGQGDQQRQDAAQVAVSLVEFAVAADPGSAPGEPVDFAVANDGVTIHNFRVVATDLAPDALPLAGQTVDESQFGEVLGFGDALAAGDERVVNVDLAPGNYVLFCNVPTHYGLGMHTAFEVTAP